MQILLKNKDNNIKLTIVGFIVDFQSFSWIALKFLLLDFQKLFKKLENNSGKTC